MLFDDTARRIAPVNDIKPAEAVNKMSNVVERPSIKGIAFDWGGVLCEDPAPGFIKQLAARFQCSRDDLEPHLSVIMDDFQRGIISEERFLSYLAEKLNGPAVNEPFWKDALRKVYREQPVVYQIIRSLRASGYVIGLMTNTEMPAREFHLECGYDFFDARIFSCDEGLVKPERAIYDLMANRLGININQLLVVDDKKANIDGAKAAGAFGILYENHIQLATDLKTCFLIKI